MPSFKQYVSVAVLLTIALPICLGYVLAFDDVERSGWRASEQTNLSDLILNNETYYYGDYTAPSNNSEIIVHNTLYDETLIRAPDYNVISGNYSSLPVFEDVTVPIYYDLLTSDISIPGNGEAAQISGDQYAGDIGLIIFTVPAISDNVTLWSSDRSDSAGFFPLAVEHMYRFARLSDSSIRELVEPFMMQPANVKYLGNISGGWISEYWGDSSLSLTVRAYRYVPIEVTADYYGEFSQFTGVKIVCDQGTIYAHGDSGRLQKYGTSLNLTLDGDTSVYTGVSSVSVSSVNNIFLTATGAATGQYADPAYGWALPPDSGQGAWYEWFNGQINRAVTMYVYLPQGEWLNFEALWNLSASTTLHIENTDSGIVATAGSNTYNLGDYDYFQLVMYSDRAFIGGIMAWPDMYSVPQIINSVTVNFDTAVGEGYFNAIGIDGPDSAAFRVDHAEAVQGTFLTTKNFGLDLFALWPGHSFAVKVLNVGVYGDYIGFGGVPLFVTDGKITFVDTDGVTVTTKLSDALFTATWKDGLWTYSINNHELIDPTSDLHNMNFAGTWSLGLMGYKVEHVTETVQEWIPGEFALKGSDFAVIGLFGAAAVFVGMGLTGRASSSKMIALAIACGSAALIFLLMA